MTLPNDLPTLRLKTLVNGLFRLVDGGKRAAPTSSVPLRTATSCSPIGAAWQTRSSVPVHSGDNPYCSARLHHRPSRWPTVTATSKQAETKEEVTTSSSAPAATNPPWRTRPAWVNPRGISSQ
jgi:hypothetical protein